MTDQTQPEAPKPKYAIIDTETSKLPDYKLPADHPDQPRLAQLAMILCDHDLKVTHECSFLIKPDGWVLEPGAAAVNGLTMDLLLEQGLPIASVLPYYTALIDQGYDIVAYGAQFDCKIMRGELRRASLPDRFEETRNVCIMRKCGPLKIVKANGKKGWPQLADACRHFGIEQGGQHTAPGDAQACLEIFRKLREVPGIDLTPEVHFAKEGSPALAGRDGGASPVKPGVPY